ncbi:MAG: hypothetical protein AAB250_16530, partial [Bdellovibrionota bacterium]
MFSVMASVRPTIQTIAQPQGIGSTSPSRETLIFAFVFSVVAALSTLATAAHAQELSHNQILERVEASREEAHDNARSILADLDVNLKADLDFTIFN